MLCCAQQDSDEFIDDTEDNTVEEVEMVLEPYFMRLDNTYNKLRSLTEYIDDTEVCVVGDWYAPFCTHVAQKSNKTTHRISSTFPSIPNAISSSKLI